MKKNFTFSRGGIHPHSHKTGQHRMDSIEGIALPYEIVLPLSQHIGAPSTALVQPGDEVREDQLIGKPNGFVSASIHSPLPGKVKEIKEITLPNGIRSEAVVIEVGKEFKKIGKNQDNDRWQDMKNEELITLISDKGIVGLGGATFPTHVKLSIPPGKSAEILIVNAAECEPFLQSDYLLMMQKPEQVIKGLQIVQKILKPKVTQIGIEKNKKDAAEVLQNTLSEKGITDIEICLMKNRYPQGAEKNLIEALTGKEIPSGKLPLEIGAINLNVGTLYAIYEAVVLNKPLTSRLVTVAGSGIAEPRVVHAFVGTPLRQIVEECGGTVENLAKVISGGPMMGFSVLDPETPITKGTSGIVFLSDKDVHKQRRTPCLSCGRCLSACPMGLNPTTLYKNIDHQNITEAGDDGLLDCVECGSCSYSCPAGIPLVQVFRTGKRKLRSMGGR